MQQKPNLDTNVIRKTTKSGFSCNISRSNLINLSSNWMPLTNNRFKEDMSPIIVALIFKAWLCLT